MTAASCRLPNAVLPVKLICLTGSFGALGHFKDEIDAVAAAVDDHGFHADVVAADMLVGLDDVVDVGLYGGALQAAARLGFDHRRQVAVLDPLVAFESDLVEHRRLVQMHDQFLAVALDRNRVEQMGRDQRLQCRVARGLVKAPVGRGMEIRADGGGIDALVAFDGHLRPGFLLEVAALVVSGSSRRRDAERHAYRKAKHKAQRRPRSHTTCTTCHAWLDIPRAPLPRRHRSLRGRRNDV